MRPAVAAAVFFYFLFLVGVSPTIVYRQYSNPYSVNTSVFRRVSSGVCDPPNICSRHFFLPFRRQTVFFMVFHVSSRLLLVVFPGEFYILIFIPFYHCYGSSMFVYIVNPLTSNFENAHFNWRIFHAPHQSLISVMLHSFVLRRALYKSSYAPVREFTEPSVFFYPLFDWQCEPMNFASRNVTAVLLYRYCRYFIYFLVTNNTKFVCRRKPFITLSRFDNGSHRDVLSRI